ncbi:hypothetical protein BHM03_00030109 [Ensete ventricosum]|nr:hypothetical protein BHM03_00030109 [Ensete ventricosum]
MAGSCTKKTTTMSTAQVVLCKTLVDGVVGVEVEDAVAGSGTKKTTARAAGSAAISVEGSPEGSDCDVKQRKDCNRVDVLRKKSRQL